MPRRQVLGALAFVLVLGMAAVTAVVATLPARSGAPQAELAIPGAPPDRDGLVLSADGRLLYLATEDGLAVLDVSGAAPTMLRTIPMRERPRRLALAPDGRHCYAATSAGVSVVDLVTNLVTGSVAVRGGLDSVTVAPDGSRLYGPSFVAAAVVAIDVATLAVIATVPVAEYTQGPVATSADGRTVFAPVFRGVAVLDAATMSDRATVAGVVEVGPSLLLMTSADRALLYAPSATSALVVIDTASNAVLRRISGAAEGGLLTPGTGTTLSALSGSVLSTIDMAVGTPGRPTVLDLGGRSATVFTTAGDGRAFVVVPDTSSTRPGLRLLQFSAR